jgi:flagellar motor switch protein FliG
MQDIKEPRELEQEITPDEQVNGLRCAADILSHYAPELRDRLVKRIQEKAPAIAVKLEESIFSFDQVLSVAAESMPILLREIVPRDVVLALSKTSSEIGQHFYGAMSDRRQSMIKEEIQLSTIAGEASRQAQKRILQRVEELRVKGAIKVLGRHEAWA